MIILFTLPILVIIELCIIHKHTIIILLETLGIPYYRIASEAYISILCQIMNKFFKKIQQLHTNIWFPTHKQWILGILFIIYARNASPIYGTDNKYIMLIELVAYSCSHLISCKTCHNH